MLVPNLRGSDLFETIILLKKRPEHCSNKNLWKTPQNLQKSVKIQAKNFLKTFGGHFLFLASPSKKSVRKRFATSCPEKLASLSFPVWQPKRKSASFISQFEIWRQSLLSICFKSKPKSRRFSFLHQHSIIRLPPQAKVPRKTLGAVSLVQPRYLEEQ